MGIRFNELNKRLINTAHKSNAHIVESTIKPTADREHFFQQDDYSIGKFVISEGKLYEIIDKRSNYVVLIDESGTISKKFPNSVSATNEQIKYRSGTFKGVPTHSAFISVLESSEIIDVVAAIKSIQKFEKADFKYIQENAKHIGLNMAKLEEVTTAEQLQAVKIVASSFNVNTQSTSPAEILKDIKKKVSSTKLSKQQAEIYKNMLDMLSKVGVVSEDTSAVDYALEKEVMGFKELKRKLAHHSGIEDFDTKAASDKAVGVTDNKQARHSAGMSLGANSNTHRMQLIRKTLGND